MHRRAWALAAAAILASLGLAAGPAQAHALIVDADPAPNTRVDDVPSQLHLSFSEELEDSYTRIRVIGPNGTDHVSSFAIDEPGRKSTTVELSALSKGVYSVQWRTLSSSDGHTKAGGYLLAVDTSLSPSDTTGNATRPAANATQATGSHPGTGEALTRTLAFAGAAIAVGLPLVGLTLPPDRRRDEAFAATAALAATVAVIASFALVWFLAVRIDVGLGEALATQNGSRQGVRAFAFAAAGGLLGLAPRSSDDRRSHALLGAGALAGVLGLVATSTAGHAAGVERFTNLALGMDVFHQLAVAYWVAGVAAIGWLAIRDTPVDDLVAAVRRLSPAFVGAVVLIVVTGSYASWIHLASLDQLWTSGYGLALLAKIVLLAPLVALGAYHRYVLAPSLDEPDTRSRLERTIGIEVAVMVLVLVAAGLLTNTAPPSAVQPGTATAAETPGNASLEPELGTIVHQANESDHGFEVGVSPHPVTLGAQNLTVRVTPEEGFPDNATVLLNAKPPSDPYGEGQIRDLDRWTNQTWTGEGPLFTERGEWRLLVALQGKNAYAQTPFTLDVE